MVKLVSERAPAKINLYLRVVGRRDDGYHQLDSVMLPISLYDELALEIWGSSEASVSISCDDPAIPPGDENLAARAAMAFLKEFDIRAQVSLRLTKRIPAGAGLGGGSSDAAATLRGMAAMMRIEEPRRLAGIALELGADVPFFLEPRPARVTGIGEIMVHLKDLPSLNLVIAAPPFEVSTGRIFKSLLPESWSGPAPGDIVERIRKGPDSGILVNDLETTAIAQFPDIARLKLMLEESGATAAAMSGSGGAVFGIFADRSAALSAADSLRHKDTSSRVFIAQALP